MSWQQAHGGHLGTNLAPPEDGISLGNQPLGRIGKRWDALLSRAPAESKDRILRGRTFAKRGRARGLHISPGVATAEVYGKEVYHPSLRVRPFGRGEWGKITRALLRDLDSIAALLEGELPAKFMAKMERQGAALMPEFHELSFDCDCGDYIMPCAHVATVFKVLSQALDGDPFLLLTLRGRPRDHLLSTLRSKWGDDRAIRVVSHAVEEGPPSGDWFVSDRPIPEFGCSLSQKVQHAAGLLSLGPPPGDSGLMSAIMPLYKHGGSTSRELVETLPDRQPTKRRARALAPPPEAAPVAPAEPKLPSKKNVKVRAASQATKPEAKAAAPPVDLTEALVDQLAELDAATSAVLAKTLGIRVSVVRKELIELEALGLVFQDRSGDAPVWRLG